MSIRIFMNGKEMIGFNIEEVLLKYKINFTHSGGKIIQRTNLRSINKILYIKSKEIT